MTSSNAPIFSRTTTISVRQRMTKGEVPSLNYSRPWSRSVHRNGLPQRLLHHRKVYGLILATVFLLILYAVLGASVLWGNGYSTDGGLVGRWVDRHQLQRYRSDVEKQSKPIKVKFPDVQIKANRHIEKNHYSLYLSEILQRHQENQTNIQWDPPLLDYSGLQGEKASIVESIQVTGATAIYAAVHANPLEEDLRAESCRSNWFCQRCLNSPTTGSYDACSALCRRCYIRLLSTIPGRNDPPLRLESSFIVQGNRKIPRIIHQAWHFFPRSLDYPEHARMMSTWRSQIQYEHHFYHVIEEKCLFAKEHYPPVIVKACEAIESRNRRQRFLELLILYKHGGIFADADVLLETNLDTLVENDTSFFAAKSPGILDNCLWPGLVGAAPGHPVVGAAIEHFMRAFLLRTMDHLSLLERDMMGRAKDPYTTELWKFRAVAPDTSLYLYQDCAWGLAWNRVLGKENPLAKVDIGTYEKVGGGRARILLVSSLHCALFGAQNLSLATRRLGKQMSKGDTGATRITDIERNLLVASTDLPGVEGFTIQQRGSKSVREKGIAKQEMVE